MNVSSRAKILFFVILCVLASLVLCGCCIFHSYEETVTPPTCTERGYTTYTCKKCGELKIKDFTEALGHDYGTSTVAPTCTEDGGTYHVCSRCGDSYVTDVTPALGHDYEVKTVAPTCTEDGLTVFTCSRCGDTYSEKLCDPLGHTFTDTVTLEATCKKDGIVRHVCSRCGYAYEENYSLEALTSEEIYARAKESVGEIWIYDNNGNALGLGTCFAIDDGVFVTNYHVIEKAYSAKIMIGTDTLFVSDVLAFDSGLDLAVLKAAGSGSHAPALPVCHEIANGGSTVYAVGSSEGLTLSFSTGVVASPDRVIDSVHYIQHDAAISNGNSGGPLFNIYGEVIGINARSLVNGQSLNFAISSRELDRLDYSDPITIRYFAETYGNYFAVSPGDINISETEPNSSKDTAQSIVQNGTTVYGTVDRSSDVDFYKVTLGSGESLTVILIPRYVEDASGIQCVILDDIGAIAAGEVSTYDDDTVIYATFKNRSSSPMTVYVGLAYYSNYKYRNDVAEYWLFLYKKAGKVSEYDYVDVDTGLKFRAPDRWSVDGSTGIVTATDYTSGNGVSILMNPLSGSSVENYVAQLNASLRSMSSNFGYDSITISELTAAKLGDVEFVMEKVTSVISGTKIDQYIYVKQIGESVLIVTISAGNNTPLSTFESMFS